MNPRIPALAAMFSALLVGAGTAWAQPAGYPSKPIRFILPFPPGGPTDLLGRAIGQKLATQMGQPVIADNRPGAGGNLGAELASRAAPDGYTIVLCAPSLAISPALYAKMTYDPVKDLAPISLVAVIPNVLLVHPSVPAKTLKEFVALARAKPGKLNFGSGGIGTSNHLGSEMLKGLAKIDMVHVPFKGSNEAMVGMMGGHVDSVVIGVPAALPQINAGKVRALAVLSPQRLPQLPNLPTGAEAGVPGFEVQTWYGILAPAATPRDIILRLNSELVKALAAPDLRERLQAVGFEPVTTTPEQFAEYIRLETVRWAKVIKDANVKVE
jgi:tripartite-type tricarboxylate transporter receptor subunit TctC